MDLARQDDQDAAAADFAAAQRAEIGDHFSFEIARTALLDDADVAGAVRVRVRASLAGRRFEDFVVDVGFADPPVDEPDEVIGPDVLAFAGLSPLRVPTLPLPDHVAEKMHASTRRYGPHQRSSTRVKDLVDLVLLATTSELSARDLRAALRRTFQARATHPLPATLPEPPLEWEAPYRRLATALAIPVDRREAHRLAAALLDPILDGHLDDGARWDPAVGAWIAQA
jgi:hypothetical protein